MLCSVIPAAEAPFESAAGVERRVGGDTSTGPAPCPFAAAVTNPRSGCHLGLILRVRSARQVFNDGESGQQKPTGCRKPSESRVWLRQRTAAGQPLEDVQDLEE